MRSIRRILVAIKDPSRRPTPALNKAAQLARALGARLELFHALTASIAADSYVHTGRSFEDAQQDLRGPPVQRLTSLAAALAGRGRQRRLKITVATEWDAPAYEAIVRRAIAIQADLIIADRHAGRHFAPSLLHLTDWELLRLSPVPVLLIKRSGVYRRPVVLAAVDPGHSNDKPAKLDTEILRVSEAVTDALSGRLHAVHAYVPVPGGTRPTYALDWDTANRVNSKIAAGAQARYERTLRGLNIPKSRRHLRSEPPVQAIATLAVSLHSDIVVMGSLARSGLKRLLIGDTAENLLDQLPCDLLIVKPPGFKTPVRSLPSGVRVVPPVVLA